MIAVNMYNNTTHVDINGWHYDTPVRQSTHDVANDSGYVCETSEFTLTNDITADKAVLKRFISTDGVVEKNFHECHLYKDGTKVLVVRNF